MGWIALAAIVSHWAPASARDLDERRGPFTIGRQEFTVVFHRVPRPPDHLSDDSLALSTLEILDAQGRVQYSESFNDSTAGGDVCRAAAQSLTGSSGRGLLITSDCEPSAPNGPGTARILGIVSGKLVSLGKPLLTWGERLVPGAVTRKGNVTMTRSDMLMVRVWTGYFFVVVPVRVDWLHGRLSLGQHCMYQTGSGLAEEGCEMPIEDVNDLAPHESAMTFVRMFAESNDRGGPPAHVVITRDAKVEVVSSRVFIRWNEGPDVIDLAVDPDVWVKIRVDGREGWIHTAEDLNAIGLFQSG